MSVKSKPELEKESGSHFFGINKTWQRRLHCPFYLSPSLCLYLEFFLLFFFSLYAAATARTRFIAAGGTIYVLQLKAPATVSFCKFMFLRLNKSSIVRLYLKAIMFFFFSHRPPAWHSGCRKVRVDVLTIHDYLRSIRHLSWPTVGWHFSILACSRLTELHGLTVLSCQCHSVLSQLLLIVPQ